MSDKHWIPAREQDLVDLTERWEWESILSDGEKQAAYGWEATDCAVITEKITAFLTARNTYETVNSTENRIAKDNVKKEQ